ncbi:uncharacterized protein CBL_01431 [Carabus blaptoides fortunei]
MLLTLALLISGYIIVTNGCLLPKPIMSSFVDVSAKIPSGIITGNTADLGSFDQCLALDQTHNGTQYTGKYCLVQVSLSKDLIIIRNNINKCTTITDDSKINESRDCISTLNQNGATENLNVILGWCIPETCSIEDVIEYVKDILINISIIPSALRKNITIVPFAGGLCQTKRQLEVESSTWSNLELGAVAFLCVIGCVIVFSTSYDIYLHYTNKKSAHIILTAFSFKTNGEKLLTINPPNSDPLLCLPGIRYTRMMWIIFENRYSLNRGEPFVHFSDLRNFQAENMYVMGADVSADTLFFITGIAVAYEFFNAMEKEIKFNVIHFWSRKYIKLAPLMAVVVLLYATILNRFGSGPFWPLVLTPMKENCQQNWWATLLYVQNYYKIDNICIGQSWYFSVDNQMYFLCPLLLILLWKWPKYTMYAAVGLFIGSILSPFILSFYYDLPSPTNSKYLAKDYFPTHIRFGAWFMGIIFGYILYKLKNTEYKLDPIVVCFGWIISFALLLITVLVPHVLMDEHNRIKNAFFNGMHRQVWVFGLAWLVYACAHGYAGPINSFLSWSVFQSLGRLSYIMYVIHVSQQFLVTAESRTTIYYSDMDTFYKFWSDLFLTTAISACLHLSFEAPMVVIDKCIFENERPQKPKEPPENKKDDILGYINHVYEPGYEL